MPDLWFESIRPFEDGNGRLGRAIAEKALAEGLDAPAITALAETIQRHRKNYYTQLPRANLSNRIDEWLVALRSGSQTAPAGRGPGGRYITFCFCLGIVASVWILMPAADPTLRLIMIILCMWFIAMVIILNPDALAVAGSLAVVVSMAAFAFVYHIPYALALAGFLVMEGAALVMIRRMSLRSARALEQALAIVRAERDSKTRFIASASHDLQQPLQAARLYLDQLLACSNMRRRCGRPALRRA